MNNAFGQLLRPRYRGRNFYREASCVGISQCASGALQEWTLVIAHGPRRECSALARRQNFARTPTMRSAPLSTCVTSTPRRTEAAEVQQLFARFVPGS
jgi:hypothetical protein